MCCPVDTANSKPVTEKNKTQEEIKNPLKEKQNPEKIEQTPGTTDKPVYTGSISNHPNFKLIPTATACGISGLADKIIGGHDAGLGSYPWMVRKRNSFAFHIG